MKIYKKHILCLLAIGAGIVPSVSAQTTPAQTTPSADDEIVQLSTFTISAEKDNGYIAADSLAGGRQAMPIRVTPSAMSSMTSTFIQDVGIRDVREALKWTLNVQASDPNAGKGSPFNPFDYNFRGSGQSIQGGVGPTRNYFTFYQVADAYNIDRIEFDRGPNSILFGIGTIGGTLNIYTKNARTDKSFITPSLQVDNYGSARLTVDANWAISKKFALRLNALGDTERGWRNYDVNNKVAVDLAALWQATETTQIRFDIEGGKARNTILANTLAEGYSNWDGTTIANTANDTPTGGGTVKESGFSGVSYWVYNPALSGIGVQNYINSYRTDGSYLPLAPYSGFYKGTLYNGGNAYQGGMPGTLDSRDYTVGSGVSRPEYAVLTAALDQKITKNLDLGLSFYRYQDNTTATNYETVGNWAIDVNKQLPDGNPNPYFGQLFGDYFLSKQVQKRSVTEGRAQVNYNFDTGPVKQRFSLAAGLQEITLNADQFMAEYMNNPATAAQPIQTDGIWQQNMVWGRLYASQPNYKFSTPSSIGGKDIGYMIPPITGATGWYNFDEVQKISNIALVSHTRLWDDLISILAGIRYDDYDYNKVGHYDKTHIGSAAYDTTYSIGGVFYIPGARWLGAFANYSTNFNPISPNASPLLNGQPLPPNKGDGGDVGLRISTKDGKYYASASYYYGTSKNRTSNTIIGFSTYWKDYFDALGQPYDTKLTTLSYSDTESLKLHGWEFEVTANPLPNLRIQASYSLPTANYTSDSSSQETTYYAQNLPEWQRAVGAGLASGITNQISAANRLQSDLTNGFTTLQSTQPGRPQTNIVNYTFNIFANYTFDTGCLKGFSVGAGEILQGKKYIKTIRDSKWYSDAQYYTNLVLAYETKAFGHRPVRLALNIDNLLNKRDAVITDFDGGWYYNDGKQTPAPSGYYQPIPITFRLSAQITF